MDAMTPSNLSNADSGESTPHHRRITVLLTITLVLYLLIAFLGTHIPIPPGVIPRGGDKVLHFIGYSVLGALLMGLRASLGEFRWPSVVGRAGFCAGYGAFDEITQMLVGRNADVADWCADLLGASCGLLAIVLLVRVCSRRTTTPTERDHSN